MSALEQQTKPIAKDAAKDSKEPAVEASFSSAPTPQAEDASEPLFWSSLASQNWGKTRQRLGASKPLLTCFCSLSSQGIASHKPAKQLRQAEDASEPLQASAQRVKASPSKCKTRQSPRASKAL